MALHSVEVRTLGLKKEASRGSVETTPDKFRAVTADSELTYSRALIEDEAKRGISAKFDSFPGRKDGTGIIKFPTLRVSDVGEFFQMLMGDPVTAQQAATIAYKHTFNIPAANNLLLPTYTMFMERGISVQKYNLGSVSAITVAGDQEGAITMESETMFKTEAVGVIGSPTFAGESVPMTFAKAAIDIGGSPDSLIREFSVKLENGLFPLKTLDGNEDVRDLLSKGPFLANGSFVVYFESEVERAKYIAATTSSFKLTLTGPIIASSFPEELVINIRRTQYTAFPYEDQDGLFGASVTFEGRFDLGTSKLVEVELQNRVVTYV